MIAEDSKGRAKYDVVCADGDKRVFQPAKTTKSRFHRRYFASKIAPVVFNRKTPRLVSTIILCATCTLLRLGRNSVDLESDGDISQTSVLQ